MDRGCLLSWWFWPRCGCRMVWCQASEFHLFHERRSHHHCRWRLGSECHGVCMLVGCGCGGTRRSYRHGSGKVRGAHRAHRQGSAPFGTEARAGAKGSKRAERASGARRSPYTDWRARGCGSSGCSARSRGSSGRRSSGSSRTCVSPARCSAVDPLSRCRRPHAGALLPRRRSSWRRPSPSPRRRSACRSRRLLGSGGCAWSSEARSSPRSPKPQHTSTRSARRRMARGLS
mmetsp:Transcript_62557/g.148104  ORF Transcript_62557/g.148104 Transcript_62557/m.148104 type:complete len:231 (+) Transcript_62557:77-769(+)